MDEERSLESRRILEKYPERVPVLCERAPGSDLPMIERTKFLVPCSMLCGEFKYVILKHVCQAAEGLLPASQTLNLFVVNSRKVPKTGAPLSEIYDEHCSKDGFLYLMYTAENTLG
eukprot:gnl/TRDRNA2_/TRDRNA2_202878_c0_seq1.p1 gnl/TRDRNA2_/TRDRNA2_202878_c0~~gnl/TRDRNA2_/TRDRNA2_202878_c0_seq1.p1  ORF type:complete len:136 (+),score=15.82 gnl/TRDRNA2_/TRDRNA2_202878_c0_seq1:62-409(+)